MADAVLHRKAYQKLLDWKQRNDGSTAILIHGSRRVGKSFLATRFAEENYRSAIVIDFAEADPEIRRAFDYDLADLDTFFMKLTVLTGTRLHRRESVVVLENVQHFPRARAAVKYLVEDGRYDYIETGTYVSVYNNVKDIIIPSEEDELPLDPLDFEEFMWACGDEVTVPFIRDRFENMEPSDILHRTLLERFGKYMLVGGMPEAVLAFVGTHDLSAVEETKRSVLGTMADDIAGLPRSGPARVRGILENIPSELRRRGKGFRITSVSGNARTEDYEGAFHWLSEGHIVNQSLCAGDPGPYGYTLASPPRRRCYMADTGLLVTLSLNGGDAAGSDIHRGILTGDLGIRDGMFLENVAAQELHASGHDLSYYARYDRKSGRNEMEIGFLLYGDNGIRPVDVSPSKRIARRSLDRFIERFGGRVDQAYILSVRDLCVKDGLVVLPVYMASLLR